MHSHHLLSTRVNCPCCGFPTLLVRGDYDICELCNWEDDGQDDAGAGGPNAHYSLGEARRNFLQYRVMYSPNRDQRITGADTQRELETKEQLITAFTQLMAASGSDREGLEREVLRLERVLRAESARKLREYERKHRQG